MPSALRSFAVLAFVSAIAILSAPACSEQGEGERCDFAKNGDLDCDSAFTCVKKAELADTITSDRCCPAANTESDSRCARGTPMTTATGGSGGSGGSSTAQGGEANGGSGVETAAGSPSVPATGDGGMSGGGTPAVTDGGTPANAGGAPANAGGNP